jgi:hypothetical protein
MLRNLKKLSEEEDTLRNKYNQVQNIKAEQEQASNEQSEIQAADLENIMEIKAESESKIHLLDEIEKKLSDKEIKLKNQYNLLSEEDKLLFNRYLLEYDNNDSLKKEVDDYVNSNNKISKNLKKVASDIRSNVKL